MASNVGRWFRRLRLSDSVPQTLAHLAESEVADRLVTRCGREMHHRRDEPFEFVDAQPGDACYWCRPK
jgi:hypothetical protein